MRCRVHCMIKELEEIMQKHNKHSSCSSMMSTSNTHAHWVDAMEKAAQHTTWMFGTRTSYFLSDFCFSTRITKIPLDLAQALMFASIILNTLSIAILKHSSRVIFKIVQKKPKKLNTYTIERIFLTSRELQTLDWNNRKNVSRKIT